VEDDRTQQLVVAHHLQQLTEFAFAVTYAPSEEEAVAQFRGNPAELVVLDYHLTEGNGLSTLRALRQEDRIVPIIAVSGQNSPEIAAELLRSGADDYISKRDLDGDGLARSVRQALARADAWRRRALPTTDQSPRLKEAIRHACTTFVGHAGDDFLERLAAFDAVAQETALPGRRLPNLFNVVCDELAAAHGIDDGLVRQCLRPVLLELQQRLAEQSRGKSSSLEKI
jgi:CheY-like chemotaxis protein